MTENSSTLKEWIQAHPIHGPRFFDPMPSSATFATLDPRLLMTIMLKLDVRSLTSLVAAHYTFNGFFKKVATDPVLVNYINKLGHSALQNSLVDINILEYFPEAYDTQGWHVMGKRKTEERRYSSSNALTILLYMNRLVNIEADISELLGNVLCAEVTGDIAGDITGGIAGFTRKDRRIYEVLMYRALISWAQTHIHGMVLSSTVAGEVIDILPLRLPLPNFPFGSTRATFENAEIYLTRTISDLIWPLHTRDDYWITRDLNEWERGVTQTIKNAFIKSCYPSLLLKLINLRKPANTYAIEAVEARAPKSSGVTKEELQIMKKSWEDIIDAMRFWLRQVMRNCPGCGAWGCEPENGKLIRVWAALREHRAFDGNEVGPEGPGEDTLRFYDLKTSHRSRNVEIFHDRSGPLSSEFFY